MMPRDLTKQQFEKRIAARGITPDFFGYYDIGNRILVYARNGGDKRRSQLAYLIEQQRKHAYQLWLENQQEGGRAYLSETDLRGADLRDETGAA